MKKVIVTTTINPVTEAIEKYDAMHDWDLIVIGDKKTPSRYSLQRGRYVSPDEQENYDKALSDAIGWNCIQRRNFGLLYAYDAGADIVAVIDDDNIPYDNWGKKIYVNTDVDVNVYDVKDPAFDPIGATNEKNIWHRGFPLQLIPSRQYLRKNREHLLVDVQANFWNGDPDIDAICRMEHRPECMFDKSCFPFASNKISPFNSQNTLINRRILKDYFLFPKVGRMDDIWAAFYVQAKGARVLYDVATVYQKRNVHDLIRDMKQEYLGYENNLKITQEIIGNPDSLLKYLPEESLKAFELYRRHF